MKFISLLALLLSLTLSANASLQFDTNCILAYKKIMNLELGAGRKLLVKERLEVPGNQIPLLLDNYIDFFTLLSGEKQGDYDRFKKNMQLRLNALSTGDRSSPWYNYAQGEVNLQGALIKAKFQDYWSAAWEIKHASFFLQDNFKKFPDFIPDNNGRGLLIALFGSFPPGLKTAVGFLGMEANTTEGIQLMETTMKRLQSGKYAYLYDESALYLSFIQSSITDSPDNYNRCIERCKQIDSQSLLKAYVIGYVALRTGHSDVAISVLNARPVGAQYVPFAQLDYLSGIAHLNKMDSDASTYFYKFLNENQGISFIKDAYLRIAYSAYLVHNEIAYRGNLKKVIYQGFAYSEKDKQALREANAGIAAEPLLRARLSYDGGYYDKALAYLTAINIESLHEERAKLEYLYRLGRIYEALNKTADAMHYYFLAANRGQNSPYYFAANAALHLAMIYEAEHDFPHARNFYRLCLDMKEEEYKSGIDNQARDGLKRMK